MFNLPKNLLTLEFPTDNENIQSLLNAYLKEEIALAKLIQLEGDKILIFTGGDFHFPFVQNQSDILMFIKSIKTMNNLIIMKRWLLEQRLQSILLFADTIKENNEDFYNMAEEE